MASQVDLSGDGGVLKTILVQGTGDLTPAKGDNVEVHYTGKLEDGTVFDSSVERGDRFTFEIGQGQVIKGWDIGVASMKKGEKALFTLTSKYAYGETGSPPKIPPNSTLVFEVELFDWKREDVTKKKDGGVTRSIIQDGQGYQVPNDGANVSVSILGKFGDQVLEERKVSFIVGEASEAGLLDCFDLFITRMKRQEKCLVFIRRDYAWGDFPPKKFNLPNDYQEVVYEVTLEEFEKCKETWEMNEDERLEQAEYSKNRGSDFFKASKYQLALKQYKRVTQFVGPFVASSDTGKDKKNSILLAGYLNLALTYLKLNKFQDALTNCNLSLEIESKNVKALFRRGQALVAINEFEKAKSDFEMVMSLDPNNKAAQLELNKVMNEIKKHHQKERQVYANMFDKFANKDKEKEQRLAGNVWKELKDESKRDFSSIDQNTV